jgi:RNA polymerase sigma-70 factor (ECF subfamily)
MNPAAFCRWSLQVPARSPPPPTPARSAPPRATPANAEPTAPKAGDYAAHPDTPTGPSPATVAAAAAGDEDAWRAIAEEYTPRLFALARSRLADPDAAEEIVQSVFVTVAEKLPSGEYEERGTFEPWLLRIAMNRIRDHARARRRRPTAPEHTASQRTADERRGTTTPTHDEQIADNESARANANALRHAIATLSPADREIVELRHLAGMPFKAIAATLGCPLGTALARHHRALKKLRIALTGPDAPADAPPAPTDAIPTTPDR